MSYQLDDAITELTEFYTKHIEKLRSLIRVMNIRGRIERPESHGYDCVCKQCELATLYTEVTGDRAQIRAKTNLVTHDFTRRR